jgi:unspecific monooxygenase
MLTQAIYLLYSYTASHLVQVQTLLVVILAGYFLIIYPFFISPLRCVPGPYVNRISRFNALNKQRKANWIETVNNLHSRYGDVVILAPKEISVNGSSKYIHDIYVKNFPKSKFYENFRNHGFKDNIFASLENDRHLRYKKIIVNLYSKTAVFHPKNQTRQLICDKTEILLKDIYSSSVSGERPDFINAKSEYNEHGKGYLEGMSCFNRSKKEKNLGIDMYSLFGSFAIDVISGFELGLQNGTDFLSHPEERYMVLVHRIVSEMGFWTTLMPRFWNWAAGTKICKAAEMLEKWQMGLYKTAEENVPIWSGNENKTTLETLKLSGLTDRNAYSFLSDNIFAGHETTAIQLTYLTYELSRPCHNGKQKRLQQELRQAFGTPLTKDSLIEDFEALEKLPYLNALIEENGRVHSSIPGAEPRVVDRPYFVTLPGKETPIQIPLGTTISVLPYAVHRQPDIFPEPDHFVPERWLQFEAETDQDFKVRIMKQQKFMMPFGRGIRMCLGMQIALTEMKVVLANLYWHYASTIDRDWCDVVEYDSDTKFPAPILLGTRNKGNNRTDEEKMVMYDTYTSRPLNDECWLQWHEY